MSRFFIKKQRTIYSPEPLDETPFWEVQRNEALDILSYLFETWQASWKSTRISLGELNLSESGLRRLNFYETEQKSEVISLLSKLLVALEQGNEVDFSATVLSLAKELRPSLPYVEYDPEENFALTPFQIKTLRSFMAGTAVSLKDTVSELEKLKKTRLSLPTSEKPLSLPGAETLLREKIGLTYFDFVEFKNEPEWGDGYYPELLQDSVDFGF